jgi:hypothetical protein
MPMNWESHIVRDPKICAGEPVFRGTRVTLRTVLASLAEGEKSRRNPEGVPEPQRGKRPRGYCVCGGVRGEDLPVPGAPSRT